MNTKSKSKMINFLLNSGKKRTSETIVLQNLKQVQKKTKKNSIQVIKSAITNTTPIFKIEQQKSKKGKRKTTRNVPTFIVSHSSRTLVAIKELCQSSIKSRKLTNSTFFKELSNEILDSFTHKSGSVNKKTEIHKQAFLNKRYLTKFKW